MNEEKHWNKIGSNYNDEIFDVFKSDLKKRLPHYFRKHAGSGKSAIDFGCGTGKSFNYLAPSFKHVLAMDISEELLAIAKTSRYKNISFRHADLTVKNLRLPKADFAFCCNVVMLPEPKMNDQMFLNIRKSLKPGGSALFVVPSMESALYSASRMIEWYAREGVPAVKIPEDDLSYFKGTKKEIIQGLVQIDGVITKHYTDPELHVLMARAGFKVTALERLQYDWTTEFSEPPKWLGAPFPWDWLLEVKC